MSTATRMSETRLERRRHHVPAERADLRVEDGVLIVVKQAVTQRQPFEVRVPLERVRAANLRKPARGRPGWLHIAAVGGTPNPSSSLAAASDPYTVPVTARNLGAARRLARLVADHVRDRGLPAETPGAGPRSTGVLVTPSGLEPRATSPAPTVPPPVGPPRVVPG